MRKKGWFVFFCLLLLSFELVRPAEIVWFGVYSDTESLTDLQRSALEKTILQNIEDRGEVTLLHSTESVEMPADLIDVKRKFYELERLAEEKGVNIQTERREFYENALIFPPNIVK